LQGGVAGDGIGPARGGSEQAGPITLGLIRRRLPCDGGGDGRFRAGPVRLRVAAKSAKPSA